MPNDKKITRADTVTISSPLLRRGEARARDFATDERVAAEPEGSFSANTPLLPYDLERLNENSDDQIGPEKRLDYNISALPARQRFYIIQDGKAVLPKVAQAPGYFGVDVKNGANIKNLFPTMIPVIGEMAAAAADLKLPRPTITSGNDSKHKVGSLHYQNRGLDFRGNNFKDAQGLALRNLLRTRLGRNYDTLFEIFKNPQNDHTHVEYDPPKARR